jgi:hypothetical protein
LQLLQAAGLADRAPSRGKYRRKRERRAMEGMMPRWLDARVDCGAAEARSHRDDGRRDGQGALRAFRG